MTRIEVTPSGRVTCRASIGLPMPAAVAWGQLRDFRRFAAQDFFHAAVRVERGGVRRGAALEIDHRFGPFVTTRVGRILQWREGSGYSFSDLSRRGPRSGFPHVYCYRLRSTGPSRCAVEVTVAGLWTMALLPRPLVRLWLWWVFGHIAASVRNTMFELAAAAATAVETSVYCDVDASGRRDDPGAARGAGVTGGSRRGGRFCSRRA